MRAGAVEERAGSARPLDRAEVEHHGRRHIRARRGPRRGDAADTPQPRPRTPTLAPELNERTISGLNTSIHHHPTSLAPARKEYDILTNRPLSGLAPLRLCVGSTAFFRVNFLHGITASPAYKSADCSLRRRDR